jgi:glycosyltransferase involved in cell wall biosynthesis
MAENIAVSLIIPLFNEAEEIEDLITNIRLQTFQPNEIILVDGGSIDSTVKVANEVIGSDKRFKIIKVERAMPGKGRNIGTIESKNDWIAYTDAGVTQKKDWLEKLVGIANQDSTVEVVFGNVSPRTDSFFEKCAAIAYVPPLKPDTIRSKSIATCLLKKYVWEKIGGFPDFRAAEDLIFINKIEENNFKTAFSFDTMIYWHLRPNISSTFKKFVLYSQHNVWAGRQKDWHYGVLKQYAFIIFFVILGIFHSAWWLLAIPVWLILRTIKRVFAHKYEYGLNALKNPLYFFSIMGIIITIDMATFIGWIKAIIRKPQN